MSRRELERALALSRNGDVAGALDAITPKRRREPSPAKRSAGARAQIAGASFQTEVRSSLDIECNGYSRCVWTEGNPRVRGAPGAMFPVERATVDFQLLAGGIPIAFDCKGMTGRAEYSLAHVGDPKRQDAERRQIEWLLKFRQQGGIAFLLVNEAKRNRAWLVFALQTILAGESVQIRTIERAARGLPERLVDHCPAIERVEHLLRPTWGVLTAAIAHGRKTLPETSPFRNASPFEGTP